MSTTKFSEKKKKKKTWLKIMSTFVKFHNTNLKIGNALDNPTNVETGHGSCGLTAVLLDRQLEVRLWLVW